MLRPPIRDTFGRAHTYLRISLTERCNLRCLYCMPEQGIELTPSAELLSVEEMERLVRLFASMGVNKLRLTGGEPLVHRNFDDVVKRFKQVPGINTLAVTTNGITLHRRIERYKELGVDAWNISLDTLDPAKYALVTRRDGLPKVLSAIARAESLGYDPVKINCVVMRGVNDNEVSDFAALTKDRRLEVRFIEYMPFDDNKWSREKVFPWMEMVDRIETANGGAKLVPVHSDAAKQVAVSAEQSELTTDASLAKKKRSLADSNRGNTNGGSNGEPQPAPAATTASRTNGRGKTLGGTVAHGETARLFRLPGHVGSVGFITSMTTHFCGSCNRLRLTADGNLKVCLFGEDELSLRGLMRGGATDDEIEAKIRDAVAAKHFSHGGKKSLESLAAAPNRPMIKIGG